MKSLLSSSRISFVVRSNLKIFFCIFEISPIFNNFEILIKKRDHNYGHWNKEL